MEEPIKQEAECVKPPSETAINQPLQPADPATQPEPVPEAPGDTKASDGTLGAQLENAVLANKQAVSKNAAMGKSDLQFLT